jgi:predicted enzyme related to lactoylglutathione lyase
VKLATVLLAFAAGFLAGRLGYLPQPATPDTSQAAARVTGIGGVFFKANDPEALRAWYRDRLGLETRIGGATYQIFQWRDHDDPARAGSTIWSLFPEKTTYFAPSRKPFIIDYRVSSLDGMLAQLRRHGVAVEAKIADEFNGRFAWLTDPEGNRIELWEPKEGY